MAYAQLLGLGGVCVWKTGCIEAFLELSLGLQADHCCTQYAERTFLTKTVLITQIRSQSSQVVSIVSNRCPTTNASLNRSSRPNRSKSIHTTNGLTPPQHLHSRSHYPLHPQAKPTSPSQSNPAKSHFHSPSRHPPQFSQTHPSTP